MLVTIVATLPRFCALVESALRFIVASRASTSWIFARIASGPPTPRPMTPTPTIAARAVRRGADLDLEAREARLERDLSLPRLGDILGAARAFRRGDRLAEDGPRARRPADVLIAVAEVEEDARALVELPRRVELRARLVV